MAEDPQRGRRQAGRVLIALGVVCAATVVFGAILTGFGRSSALELLVLAAAAAVVCILPIVIGALLVRRAGPSPEPGAKPPLTVVRLIFAIFGALIALFSGGCGIFFLVALAASPSQPYYNVGVVALLSLPPLAAGLLIWWLAVKAGRGHGPDSGSSAI